MPGFPTEIQESLRGRAVDKWAEENWRAGPGVPFHGALASEVKIAVGLLLPRMQVPIAARVVLKSETGFVRAGFGRAQADDAQVNQFCRRMR